MDILIYNIDVTVLYGTDGDVSQTHESKGFWELKIQIISNVIIDC